ncbi:MAG: glycosyl hydrolase family 18 [Lachnospiraceae bacterium]|nr:glycosyl hydrolase family 18 [Lachnospiraceae bacterium]
MSNRDMNRDMQGRRSGRVVKVKRNRSKRKRRIIRTLLPPLVAVVLIAVIVIVAIKTGLFESFSYSDTQADLFEYYGVSDELSAVLIKDHEISDERIIVKDSELYIPYDTVKSEYTDRFYHQKTDDTIIYTTETDTFKTVVGESSYSNNAGNQMAPYAITYRENAPEGDIIYMALDYLKLFCNIEVKLCGGNGEPYRAVVKNEWGSINTAIVTKEHALRTEMDKKSAKLSDLVEGQSLTVIGQEGEWTRVETEDLLIGYAQTEFLSNVQTASETPVNDALEETFTSLTGSEKVVLMWHSIAGDAGNDTFYSATEGTRGINVIAPTWLSLSDDNGNIRSFASGSYVDNAHAKGMKVWVVADDFNSEGNASQVLPYPDKRSALISQIISKTTEVGADGINIDFETIGTETGEDYIQFIRELSLEAHKSGLVVSVDNYVPKAFNRHYHRREQGIFADYVVIMGYDETYAGSAKAGSVASIGYVKEGIEETLKEVPADKVINAVPFYTRVWEETPKTDEEIAATAPGEEVIPYNLKILATPSMKQEDELLSNYNATKTWDETTMQNYSTWKIGETTYEVWLEDEVSLSAKLGLMKGYGLGGMAGWEISLAAPYVWDVIEQVYK